jgi:hypothetical protein
VRAVVDEVVARVEPGVESRGAGGGTRQRGERDDDGGVHADISAVFVRVEE